MHKKFKSLFMLDPGIIYLNHGSYGACPKPVFDTLVKYQKQLEFEPTKHLAHDVFQYLGIVVEETDERFTIEHAGDRFIISEGIVSTKVDFIVPLKLQNIDPLNIMKLTHLHLKLLD